MLTKFFRKHITFKKILISAFFILIINNAYLIIINSSSISANELDTHFFYTPHFFLLLIGIILSLLISLLLYTGRLNFTARTSFIATPLDNSANYSHIDSMLFQSSPTILCIKDNNGRWLRASKEYLNFLGDQYVDYYGKTDIELVKTSNINAQFLIPNAITENQVWQQRKAVNKLKHLTDSDGDNTEVDIFVSPIFDKDNKPFRLVISGQIIHQSRKEKNRLLLMDALFYNSHLSFIILDKDLNFLNVNKAFTTMTGFLLKDIKDKNFAILNASKKHNLIAQILRRFSDHNFDLWRGEILCANSNGNIILAKLEITRILNQNNVTTNFFATLIDVTKQRKNEQHIIHIAHYDALTGLANRVMFLDRLSQSLSESKRHTKHSILFFIDLDQFKAVNDSLGHDAGDEILKETARRFLTVTRKEDIVARFSGDEFAVLLSSENSHEHALYIASMIAKKIIQETSRAYYFKNREVFIGSSIGITIYPEDGDSSELLLKNSDIAMYDAKNRGRNNYQFYKEEFSDATKDRLLLESKLHNAISKDELRLYFQPQYSLDDRKIIGAEVLIRWLVIENGMQKMIPPDYFIPLAESSGLIIEIGKWIIEKACEQHKIWLDEGLPIPQLSVNVSARQFMDSGFIHIISESLNKVGLSAEHLELEITESMLIGDNRRIELQLKRLKKMGIKIALDDFGTGYSSLSYLKNFPIDVLKIDQSFIRELTVDSKDAKIACAIIEMGHSLDQKIVAEGVETEAQLMFLNQNGCDYIQGYYFSRPLPAYKMTALLKEQQ